MYLLIPADRVPYCRDNIHLHPTMYLLIRHSEQCEYAVLLHLHPTMYLLIPGARDQQINYSRYLHPTMYLLIPFNSITLIIRFTFTSHYVSINSFNAIITSDCFYNLHPTMYLLILFFLFNFFNFIVIYIPLCIY